MTRAIMLAAFAWVMLLPGASALEATCQFTTECFEAEACDETDFDLQLTPGEADGTVVIGSQADDVSGLVGAAESGATKVIAQSPSTLQILTIGPDGAARYSLHLTEGPAVLSYLGSCESK